MKNSKILKVLGSLVGAGLLLGAPAFGQLQVAGNTRADPVIIELSPEMERKITVTVKVTNKNQQQLGFELIGPPGTAMRVSSRMASAPSARAGTRNAKQEYPLTLITSNGEGTVIRIGQVNSSALPDASCACYTTAEIQDLIRQSGNTLTRAQFCQLVQPMAAQRCAEVSAPQQTNSSAFSFEGGAFIRRNACDKGGHQVLVDLDLTNVAAESLTGNLELRTAALAYDGDRRASIKPSSDGRFKGQPLLLAAPVGGMGSSVFLVKNNSTKASSVRVADLIYYNGVFLRVPISKYMSGGKGTFEIRSGAQGYGICAKLKRTRQNFNGYRLN